MNVSNGARSIGFAIAVAAGLAWSLLLNGTIPFVGMPGLGQQISMLGYAQSFANQHWYSLHAHAFGYPMPSALVMGLPLTYVAGWLLRLGFGIDDTYSLAAALWLALAYWGAMRLATRLGCAGLLKPLAATTWLSLPIVWAHEGYSSLALGIAMLPLYFNSALALNSAANRRANGSRHHWAASAEFVALSVIALFMDGYTFMMFAMTTTIAASFHFVMADEERWYFLRRSGPVIATGLGLAFLLYRSYTGHSGFDAPTLDFFRGWGLDLAFLVRPSLGDIWLGDLLGYNVPRSDSRYWGDFSVWTTTFALPIVIAGMGSAVFAWQRDRRIPMLVCIALIGLYLALGPTLKIDAVKPSSEAPQTMAAEYGVMNTGTAWLYSHVPGFRNMRATYRWEAMFLLGAWALIAIGAAHGSTHRRYVWIGLYLLLIVSGTPPLRDAIADSRSYREGLREINRDLVAPLSRQLPVGSKVLFLPFGNDAMSVYLSPQLRIFSYNVSSDKQIDTTHAHWPEELQGFQFGRFAPEDLPILNTALLSGAVDVVVIPYFSNLWAAHMWPCADGLHGYSQKTMAIRGGTKDFLCPPQMRAAYAGTIAQLKDNPILNVTETPLYVLASLRSQYRGNEGRVLARAELLKGVRYPLDIQHDAQTIGQLLELGWASAEPGQRWSTASASMLLPVPGPCQAHQCKAIFRFWAFAASQQRPVDVQFAVNGTNSAAISQHVTVMDQAVHGISIDLPTQRRAVELSIHVPQAASPAALGASADTRILGISLQQISISPQ